MRIFVTADLHLGHANIIKYCNRPFENVEEMNAIIIKKWNERVKDDDLVYVIGDMIFNASINKNLIDYLNGRIILITGNHDRHNRVSSLNANIDSIILNYANNQILLTHDPKYIQDEDSCYEMNLVGHVHNNWKVVKTVYNHIILNVGVDVNNFYPITLDEAIYIINHTALNKTPYYHEANNIIGI